MDTESERGETTWPVVGGTMGALIRAYDWHRTPLGAIDWWPQSLRTVVDLMLAARQPVYIAWGPELTSLYNDHCIPILGTKHPGCLGKPYREVWAETWDEYRGIVQATMAGEAQHFVDQPIALDGRPGLSMSWFTFSWTPLHDEAGAVAGFFAAATETTAKIRMEETLRASREEALRRSEERLRRAMEIETVGVLFFDPAGTIKEANDAFLTFSGFTREDVAAGRLRWQELTPPEHLPVSWRTFNALVTTGRAPPYEKEYFRKDGSRWWGLFAPRLLAEGEAVEFILEITERKRMEAALRTSEERYRGLVETQTDLIVRLGADGRFTFANDRACQVLGRSREELLSCHWAQFVHPEDAGGILEAIEETKASPDHRTTVEARIRTVNGVRWYAWEGYAIFDEAGAFVEKQSVGRDITERKAMEDVLRHARDEAERARDKAEQATLAKSKFLAAASHDLRQPLQSLLLFLDVLKPHVAPEGQEPLKHLGRGLDALRDLLDGLLDISRLDASVIQPVVEDFPVSDLVDPIGAAYAPLAAAKGLELRIARCAATVCSDRTLLGRMIRNLVENALRYTEAGRIAISCRETENHLRIEVGDTGIGIPPEHLEWIWQEFHQVGNPERDRNRGLGLGLSIVQRLSHLLDHPVHVRSTPGVGSVFSVEVPLGESAPALTPASPPVAAGNGRFAVLVDDDAIVLLGLSATFRGWGYEVLAAGSTDQALARLREGGRRPDIIVADYRLREGRCGTEAILRVREAYGSDVPGVILTGETGSEVQHDAAEHGFYVIHKPVTPRQLGEALEKLLAGDR
ncbi:PAS domain-containing hybrid sensor histidine kinase/response regulator [Azospirillum sp.]|uniref:PAS domain-containing hybrid sensor histidine kinase/response regulator n=1 Tax=Azospirillum sp. TaxID=34012 RepID=UPI003D739F83